MGNCVDQQRASSWAAADDDDEDDRHYEEKEKAEDSRDEKRLLVGKASSKEVKIRITKKQLEELLRRVDAKGMPLQQLLADLMAMGHHHWRPALQSIPEGL